MVGGRKFEKGYIMTLKQELDRIKKELADLNYRVIYGKTLTELIQEIILKYS
jgi:hypothetical protein